MHYKNYFINLKNSIGLSESYLQTVMAEAVKPMSEIYLKSSIPTSYLDNLKNSIGLSESHLQTIMAGASTTIAEIYFDSIKTQMSCYSTQEIESFITRESKSNKKDINKPKEYSSKSINRISNNYKIIKYLLILMSWFLLFLTSECQEHFKDEAKAILNTNT